MNSNSILIKVLVVIEIKRLQKKIYLRNPFSWSESQPKFIGSYCWNIAGKSHRKDWTTRVFQHKGYTKNSKDVQVFQTKAKHFFLFLILSKFFELIFCIIFLFLLKFWFSTKDNIYLLKEKILNWKKSLSNLMYTPKQKFFSTKFYCIVL